MKETMVFFCPECEGHEFVLVGATGQEILRCRGCGHQWRRDDDYVYFVLVKRFTSPREYQRYKTGADRRDRWFVLILLVVLWLASMFGALRVGP
jgi:uncharacterized C2H2 Zn-finger protein